MNPSPDFWAGRRVLLTGHTGFKGTWLALWLQRLGADLTGLALAPPAGPNLFEAAEAAAGMRSVIQDVRDADGVAAVFAEARPEIVIHMAAQPLVLASYADPIGTYATNVMGTVHLFEAARRAEGLRALVNVTTDKCYEDGGRPGGCREDDPMGGHDPYSSSKGCSELVTAAYRRSFLAARGANLASARAGNVVGGGDWAADRVVPDLLRAFAAGAPASIRRPAAVRPWQHVLEPLSGYLLLAERLCGPDGAAFAEGWNFGPDPADIRPVAAIADGLAARWGAGARWERDARAQPHEADLLTLDIGKARARLGWAPRWSLDATLDRVHGWHRAWRDGAPAAGLCRAQIEDYEAAAGSER